MPGVTLNVPLTASGVAVLPIEQGIPSGRPGVWTVTVRFGDDADRFEDGADHRTASTAVSYGDTHRRSGVA